MQGPATNALGERGRCPSHAVGDEANWEVGRPTLFSRALEGPMMAGSIEGGKWGRLRRLSRLSD